MMQYNHYENTHYFELKSKTAFRRFCQYRSQLEGYYFFTTVIDSSTRSPDTVSTI